MLAYKVMEHVHLNLVIQTIYKTYKYNAFSMKQTNLLKLTSCLMTMTMENANEKLSQIGINKLILQYKKKRNKSHITPFFCFVFLLYIIVFFFLRTIYFPRDFD